jgi:GNAT superfamily N-acetyltransferase
MDEKRDLPTLTANEIEAFAGRFERCSLAKEEWTHAAHLTVAIWNVSRYAEPVAVARVREGIKRLNESLGGKNTATSGYHESITVSWMRLAGAFLARDPSRPIDDAARAFVAYGERDVPFRYYTRERLMSSEARLGWVEPDLAPLPELGVAGRVWAVSAARDRDRERISTAMPAATPYVRAEARPLVARDGDGLVGWAAIDRGTGATGEARIYVHEEHRRALAGSALVEGLVASARSRGLERLTWRGEWDAASRRFAERHGFRALEGAGGEAVYARDVAVSV